MLGFLENHDEVRLASDFYLGNGRKGLAPLAVSMLFNTAPFMIYFGQEYGERGMLEEGYSGRDGRTSIYDWCCLETADPAQRDLELYERYKQLTALAADPVFSEGKSYDLMYLNPSGEHFDASRQFAFMRSWGGRGALVVTNFADHATDVRLNIDDGVFSYMEIEKQPQFFDTIHIEANDYAIIKTL